MIRMIERLDFVCCLAVGALLLVSPAAHADVPHTLRVCGDVDEFPPYTFFLRDGNIKTNTAAGYNIDYLNTLLSASGRRAVITRNLARAR